MGPPLGSPIAATIIMSHTYGSPSNAISIIIIIWVKGICTAIANLPISAEYRDKGLTGDRGPYSTNGQYQEYMKGTIQPIQTCCCLTPCTMCIKRPHIKSSCTPGFIHNVKA